MDYLLLHHTLLALDRLKRWNARLVGTVLAGMVALLAVVVGLLMRDSAPAVAHAGLLLAFVLADGWLLASLPRHRLSFGPIQPPLMSLAVVRWFVSLVCAAAGLWMGLPASVLCAAGFQLAILLVSIYGCVIEPNRLTQTVLPICSTKLQRMTKPLRIVHLSDLHMESPTRRDERVLDRVEDLAPDLIVLTGDYLNLSYATDRVAAAQARDWLSRLSAPLGVFAVLGTPEVDVRNQCDAIFQGSGVTLLCNQSARIHWSDMDISLVGITCERKLDIDSAALERVLSGIDSTTFTILLYHTPDLMPEAVAAGVDLYLAGHTHGGQWRLPWYGAIITSSEHGKRYEMGRYTDGNTILYVSRGLGMEGLSAPRARFLCPPELVAVTLQSLDEGEFS